MVQKVINSELVSLQIRSVMRKEIEKAGVKDPQVLDKSYWIQRVGEVSIQMYWLCYHHGDHCSSSSYSLFILMNLTSSSLFHLWKTFPIHFPLGEEKDRLREIVCT